MIKKIVLMGVLVSSGATFMYGMMPQTPQEFYQHVQTSVRQSIDINQPVHNDFNGSSTLLHEAARHGYAESVWYLLKHGAQVNPRDNDQQTPLHLAALANHIGVVQLLVNHHADVNAKDNMEQTPLHNVCELNVERNSLAIAQILLKAGAQVDAENSEHITPLQCVLEAEEKEEEDESITKSLVQLLSSAGANLMHVDIDGSTGLHKALTNSNPEVIKFLLNKLNNPNAQDGEGNTLLHTACALRAGEKICLLLSHGADSSKVNNNNQTPLMTLLQDTDQEQPNEGVVSYPEMIELLLNDMHNDINARDSNQDTLLHYAARYDTTPSCEVVALILSTTRHIINAYNNKHQTPLYNAVVAGDIPAVLMLLQAGADVTVRDYRGITPLGRLVISKKLNRMTKFKLARLLVYDGDILSPYLLQAKDHDNIFLDTLSERSFEEYGIDKDFVQSVMSQESFRDCQRDVFDACFTHDNRIKNAATFMKMLHQRELTGRWHPYTRK